MASGKIDVHSLRELTDQEISIDKFIGTGTSIDERLYKKSAHRRDDHYLFIFQKKGRSKVIVDFKEIELIDCAVLCILPGQIHYGVAVGNDPGACCIILDGNLSNDDFQAYF